MQLRLLGSVELTGADAAGRTAVISQPKRLVFLTYLLLTRQPQRRDTLLALFWPDQDDDSARAALRQAVRYLRRHLGEDVIVNRGRSDVEAGAGIWTDVQAFEAAVARGAHDEALELYRGELLRGCHVADAAPEFQYWLDGERARLHRLATAAAAAAAAAAESAGDAAAAERYLRARVALDVYDERANLALVCRLARSGDRAGALRAFQGYARACEELGVELSPEARAAADELRCREGEVSAVHREVIRDAVRPDWLAGVLGDSPGPPPAPRRAVASRLVAARQIAAVVIVGICAVVLLGGALLRPLRIVPPPTRVLALGLRTGGVDPSMTYLPNAVVDLFGTALLGHLDLVSLPDDERLAAQHRHDRRNALRVADSAGAAFLLTSALAATPTTVSLDGVLFRVGTGQVVARINLTGPVDSLPALVGRLARQVLAETSHKSPQSAAYRGRSRSDHGTETDSHSGI